ncbi:MAG: hypothetical protein ACE5KU_03165 [Nitrososphaerales archaeon]
MSRRRRGSTVSEMRSARKGVRRWVRHHPQRIGRTAFLFQRVTGLGLTVYFVVHTLSVGTIFSGEDAWAMFLRIVETPIGWFGELLLLATIGFHAANGVRLILGEFGLTLAEPTRPDYPFKVGSFNLAQKSLLAFAIVVAALFFLLGYLFIFLRL